MKQRKKNKPRQFMLSPRAHGKLYRLCQWVAAIPDDIELGDDAWNQIEDKWQTTLQKQLGREEIVRIELEGAQLVAYVWEYTEGETKETRIPVVKRGIR